MSRVVNMYLQSNNSPMLPLSLCPRQVSMKVGLFTVNLSLSVTYVCILLTIYIVIVIITITTTTVLLPLFFIFYFLFWRLFLSSPKTRTDCWSVFVRKQDGVCETKAFNGNSLVDIEPAHACPHGAIILMLHLVGDKLF